MPTVQAEVLSAAIEFCRRSLVWKYTSVNDIVAGTSLYTLDVPDHSAVGAIEGVAAFGATLLPRVALWPSDGAAAKVPVYYVMDPDKKLLVYPEPTEDGADELVVHTALEPTHNAETLPDFLIQQHKAAIVSGAAAAVLSMVGQPWANPQLALYHMRNFKSEIAKVRIATIRSSSVGTISIASDEL